MFKNLITKQNAEGYKVWRNEAYKLWFPFRRNMEDNKTLVFPWERRTDFFPSCLYGIHSHCYCTARTFSLYLEDKTAWASFCSNRGTLTKYTDWKEGDVLKSTWGNKLIMADWVLNIYNTASSSSLWATCLPSLLNLYTLTGHSSEKSYVHNIRYAWNTGRL